MTARSVRSTAIEIQWLAGFNGFSIVIRYHLEMLKQGTTQWRVVDANIPRNMLKYTVAGLMPFTTYTFRMRTYTEVGQSAYSAVASARTLEDGIFSSLILLSVLRFSLFAYGIYCDNLSIVVH